MNDMRYAMKQQGTWNDRDTRAPWQAWVRRRTGTPLLAWGALTLSVLACGGGEVRPGGEPTPEAQVDAPAIAVSDAPGKVDCTHRGSGKAYEVGPNQAYANVGDVPWEALGPGDTVRIHWRPEPYREKVIIARSGTQAQPLRVCGVPGREGARPVLDGDGATTRPQLGALFGTYQSWSLQQRGIIVIWAPKYGERVEHVHVEGLQLQGMVRAPYRRADLTKFKDWDGAERTYDESAAAVRLQRARNVVIRGNFFTHNPNGIFTASQSYEENHMVRDVLVEGNVFFENALTDTYNRHQAYLQGTDFVVQYNAFRSPVPGSGGNCLKMRTAGDVVRYNYFENGARSLDMVELEDHIELIAPWQYARYREALPPAQLPVVDALQPLNWLGYQASYVYGNIFDLHGPDAPSNPIHYGFDNSPLDRRPGRLYFYYNTLVARTDPQDTSTVRLLDCCSDNGDYYYGEEAQLIDGVLYFVAPPINGGPPKNWGPMTQPVAEQWPQMRAYNNVVVLSSRTAGSPRSDFELTRWRADRMLLGRNFITTGWDVQDLDSSSTNPGYGQRPLPEDEKILYPGGNVGHHVEGAQNVLTDAAVPLDLATFAPLAGSLLKGAALPLPAEVPPEFVPHYQVSLDFNRPDRLVVSERRSLRTLGAVE
ncbi:hypothetical protein [Pyxidicoccus xibeiensis]|uniref:hypothetical protein n=1 Tax=Pyxidicoccus xibeiensis TaxID=2906759 RepID=UPI0020A72EAE|nr:hypothetical protein [Pyxidicoccus xibeiensis]MCP3139895.1 hypothetical protein [Pyxidicoccus xibeiensis]